MTDFRHLPTDFGWFPETSNPTTLWPIPVPDLTGASDGIPLIRYLARCSAYSSNYLFYSHLWVY
jgi:hypothetical protein